MSSPPPCPSPGGGGEPSLQGRQKSNITVYLHYSVRITHGVDKDGDKCLVLGEVKRYPPLVVWVGEARGRVDKEVQKINLQLPRILNTVSNKGKSTEKTMLYCFQNTFRKTKARHLYTLDGAPAHMHAAFVWHWPSSFTLCTLAHPTPPRGAKGATRCISIKLSEKIYQSFLQSGLGTRWNNWDQMRRPPPPRATKWHIGSGTVGNS